MTTAITAYLQTLRLFSRDVRLYLFTAALVGFSFFGIMNVLLNLYLLRLGYGPAFIGLVNGGPALAFAASALPAGLVGAHWGYRRSLILGVSLISAGVVLLPLAEYLPAAWQAAGIMLTRLLNGLGFALYIVNINPYLMGATAPPERNHVFSIQGALFPLAGFAGNLVAGIMPEYFARGLGVSLDQPAPYRYPLILAGLLLVPAIFALFTTQKVNGSQPTPAGKPKPEAGPYLLMACLALTGLLRVTGEGAARTFFNVYLDADLGISTARIGVLIALSQIVAGPAALATPMLIIRAGKIPIIVSGSLGMAGGLLLMGLLPHWLGVSLGFIGVIGLLSITGAVTNVMQMEIVSPAWRGATSGLSSMAGGLGFASMALGGGYIVPVLGYRGLFLISAGLVTASALLFWLYFRTPRGEYARQLIS
jgi:MFS family permease